ncbi:MAG: hypothetical protein FWE25_03265 [Lachnospiraceae bacterium]|nr:hypothetical protein [Lachnospiraceae bacterium]
MSRPTKVTTSPLFNQHGSLYKTNRVEALQAEQSLSISITIDVRKLGKYDRELYKRFVLSQFARHGILYAIDGMELIYTLALVRGVPEVYSNTPNSVTIDVDFTLPWGYWVTADPRTIFFQRYDLCDWNEYFCLRGLEPCVECDCLCVPKSDDRCRCDACLSRCDYIKIENSLCVRGWDALRTFVMDCESRYRIIMDCSARDRLWHRIEDLYDFSFCRRLSESYLIATTFIGQTTITTNRVTMFLDGEFIDPIITLNSTTFKINGHFNGRLVIKDGLTVQYIGRCGEICTVDIPQDDIEIQSGFRLYVQQGSNSVRINTGECNIGSCVRIRYQAMTP